MSAAARRNRALYDVASAVALSVEGRRERAADDRSDGLGDLCGRPDCRCTTTGSTGFTAEASSALWLTDITEHRTAEGKLYLCAITAVHSNRIVGYSVDKFRRRKFVYAFI